MLLPLQKLLVRTFSVLLVLSLALAAGGRTALAQSTIDTVVHYVEGEPSEDKVAYDVTAYVSVADSTGNPIKDLAAGDFTVVEDSQQMEILSAELAKEDPIHLVLLLDTSGSMAGQGITAAKAAASNFIAGLEPEDRVAVVTFDDTTRHVIDFTTDHKAARDELSFVDATRGAGTCLYDAAYQAVQMTATVPSGRRAVVLFTDGVDEKPGGGTCSIHTADDVIGLATDGGTRSPIYTLGMGRQVDEKALQRLAQDTGGRFLYSPDANQLDAVFIRLSDTLRSQYAIRYSSTAGPGAHTLAVTAKYLSAQDTDTRGFLLPNFPLRLSFVEPSEGQEISGMTTLKVETFGQGDTIQSLRFEVNGATVATVETAPYEAQVDFSSYAEGDLTIEAIAQGVDGIELARVSQSVVIRAAAADGTSSPTPAAAEGEEESGLSVRSLALLVGGILFLGALLAGIIAIVVIRNRQQHQRDLEWQRKVSGIGLGEAPTVEDIVGGSDRTVDTQDMSPDALGRLTVNASDDPSMIGQQFDLLHSQTTLGRKADNDIIFPKDSPVSRHHAVIEERGGSLYLSEVEESDETGHAKRPTYGTFVNEREVSGQAIQLQNGDEIRLGKRVRLKFEASERIRLGNETTYDAFTAAGDSQETQEI